MNTPISPDGTPPDPPYRDEPPDAVSGCHVQSEQDPTQDEVGALAGAIGLVTVLERFGYTVRTRRIEACWEALIRGHGESWRADGKTAVEALEDGVRQMVPCEIGRLLLHEAIAENSQNEPSAPSCT